MAGGSWGISSWMRKKEDAMLPLKQPHTPVLKDAADRHLATFKTYVPPVPHAIKPNPHRKQRHECRNRGGDVP